MTLRYSSFILFFILLMLVSSFALLVDTFLGYGITFVTLTFVIFYLLTGKSLPGRFFWFDLLPLFFIAAWVYGVYLGFFKGNATNYIIRNFAGMFLYIIYFVIVSSKLEVERIVKVLFWAAIINAFYSYAYTTWLVFFKGLSYYDYLRMYYSPGLSVLGPFLALSLYSSIKGNSISRNSIIFSSRLKNMLFFFFLFIPYAILSFSKGYFASAVILLVLVLFVVNLRSIQQLKVSRFGALFTFFAVLSIVTLSFNYWDELVFSFSASEQSNSVRSEQAPKIISELSLTGAGLGAVLDSGYARSELAYGFELSFLSIIHKLGLVGVLVCFAYAICIAIPLFYMFFRKENFYSWLAIGGMLFVVPSYGNPMIFSPVIVILHCCNMYFIRELVLKRN